MTIKKTLIIAEAGVNHNGNLQTAKKMIDVAAKAKVDIVKFQTFTADSLVIPSAKKAIYQKNSQNLKETQYQMLKKLELNKKIHIKLMKYCKKKNIEFLSSAFDIESLNFLNSLKLKRFKVPSGEINNLPYLRCVGSFNKQIILSTGVSTLLEIKNAVKILEKSGTSRKKITILHCNTEYPTPFQDINLRAMHTIKKEIGINVGYSDHSLGTEVPAIAVAMGASIIEKHFTLNRFQKGPDHYASLDPKGLNLMVSSIRTVEKIMGSPVKKPRPSEIKNKTIIRKSIVAKTQIEKGQTFTKNNLTVKRPGTGLSPLKWDKIIGKISKKNYKAGNFIK